MALEMLPDSAAFRRAQDEFFSRADADHFDWQTRSPYQAESEAALLAAVAPATCLLEIGCGEGGNLFHVAPRCGKVFGMDRSLDKVRFARSRLPAGRFVCADAAHLPVRDGAFDAVLIRDLLHHVPDRTGTLGEAWRARMGKHYPAVAMLEVKGLVDRGALVEIEATAVIGGER